MTVYEWLTVGLPTQPTPVFFIIYVSLQTDSHNNIISVTLENVLLTAK